MEQFGYILLGFILLGGITFLSYLLFYNILRGASWLFGYTGTKTLKSIAGLLSTLFAIFIFFGTFYLFSPSGLSDIRDNEYKIYGLEGKILINFPDTLKVYEKERLTIRIAKSDLEDSIFVERVKHFRVEKATIERLRLSTAMKVNLRESPNENRILINRLNNNEIQIIDTTKFSEWLFDIKPLDYGSINLVVSVSSIIKTEFGNQEIDYPVYEKDIEIFASGKDKILVFWNNHYWIVLGAIILLFLLVYKLIPNQSIIEVHMANSNQTNFWNAGSLGLVIYIITIASIGLFKMLEISLYFVPLVFVGTILIYAIFTAVSLRDNDKLSEENFLKLMGIAIKKIPPLNWIFKDDTPSV